MKPLLAIFSLLLGACCITAPEPTQYTVASREVTIPVSVEVGATPANAPLPNIDSPRTNTGLASDTKASFAASGCASGQCPMMRSTPNAAVSPTASCASSGVANYERPRLFRGRLLGRWRR